MDHKSFLKALSAEEKATLTETEDAAGLWHLAGHLGLILGCGALIAAKAPNATVYVIGYPTIAPDAANIRQPEPPGCFTTAIGDGNPPFPVNSFPYTQTDTLYLHYIEKELDARIQAAATTQGFTYLPTWARSRWPSTCRT